MDQQQNESQASNNEVLRNEQNAKMLETGDGADVFFQVGKEKELITAHRRLLCAGSEVFHVLFNKTKSAQEENIADASSSDDEEEEEEEGTEEKPIKVPDASPDAFLAFLCFIYTGNFGGTINRRNVLHVYMLGKKYKNEALVQACRDFLLIDQNLGEDNAYAVRKLAQIYEDKALLEHCWTHRAKQLTVGNVVAKLLYAQRHWGLKGFVEHCWRFVEKNVTAVLQSKGFLLLDQAQLCELFGRDTLEADELFLFQSLNRWANQKCEANSLEPTAENKQKIVGKAIYQVRIPLITEEDFTKHIVPTGLLTEEDLLAMNIHFGNFSGTGEAKAQNPNRFSSKTRSSTITTQLK